MRTIPVIRPCVVWCGLAVAAAAQFDNRWVEFRPGPGHLSAATISDQQNAASLAWCDLDKDGWVDLVVVRKQPFSTTGKRTNILLMNQGGVLTDRTADFAEASDVPGDQGFLTATNDRDVVVTDVDQDGWPDLVTATTFSDGDPKAVGHPRVYRNLGRDGGGQWLGLRYEEARIPQLLHFSSGQALNPHFTEVDAGDLTGDGFPDLYFIDQDGSSAGGEQEPPGEDLNDRLLVNDGNGFFTDQSQVRMTSQMLLSAFGLAVRIVDMNGDGAQDVVKDTALNSPQYVSVAYQDPANEGWFSFFDTSPDLRSAAPYHIDVGDLNNDGLPDIIYSDDAEDRYRFHLGNDIRGMARMSGGTQGHAYDFLSGGDDGFAYNILVADLDGDGWNDTLHADVDVDVAGFNRRLHIYHNRGGVPGSTSILLREERQLDSGSSGGGWLGVPGPVAEDLRGTYDVAAFDLDNDTDVDLVLSRALGTNVWLNQTSTVQCQESIGFQGPGFLSLTLCGDDLTTAGSTAVLAVTGAPPGELVPLVVGMSANPTPFKGGFLVPLPIQLIFLLPAADATGQTSVTVPGAAGSPSSVYLQAVVQDGGTFDLSNALLVQISV